MFEFALAIINSMTGTASGGEWSFPHSSMLSREAEAGAHMGNLEAGTQQRLRRDAAYCLALSSHLATFFMQPTLNCLGMAVPSGLAASTPTGPRASRMEVFFSTEASFFPDDTNLCQVDNKLASPEDKHMKLLITRK